MSPRSSSSAQGELFEVPAGVSFSAVPSPSCLEGDLPIDAISVIAEKESWRKEIHRPATHTHKWWAQRLGSVFRSILLGALSDDAETLIDASTTRSTAHDLVVFDPFAGSGTTLVEAAKLGARVIGRDINPVATLVQRQAVAEWDLAELEVLFKQVEHECRDDILELYLSKSGDVVLYFFWVALAECPDCSQGVELFSDYVFAKHAYAKRNPLAHAVCPKCRSVVSVDLSNDVAITCGSCRNSSPFAGAVSGQWMTCASGHRNRVVDALAGRRPTYKPYAKLVTDAHGRKRYEGIDDFDHARFTEASRRLALEGDQLPLPSGVLDEGYNTRQALRWGFSEWVQFFNDRQLYCLGRLAKSIRELDADRPEREALVALFSGTLEFNNMFCSYKGEGTGAVRHIFSHHILKPERTPLEANPWGTPQSSGAFSTLFDRRLRRAHEYKANPHDIALVNSVPKRIFGVSHPPQGQIATNFATFDEANRPFYLATGDSSDTDLPDSSVDLIVTDPPFMDNVHYSELADFFHAWLGKLEPFSEYPTIPTTRRESEVQSTTAAAFGSAIGNVFDECHRVLKGSGLLAFTFHQARVDGWVELIDALARSGFVVTSLQPVKAEMSVSATKAGAAEPSNLDSIVVCRKSPARPLAGTAAEAKRIAVSRLARLKRAGITVSKTDITSVVNGSVLAMHTCEKSAGLEDLTVTAAALVEEALADLG